jgi:UDP-sulfoquinovose synthase
MRVFIAGIDGYLGWPLALHLAGRGHEVQGADTLFRREWVAEMDSQSATPIRSSLERRSVFQEKFKQPLLLWEIDLRDYTAVQEAFKAFNPEAIVHLGQQPSAAWSMVDVVRCTFSQVNNITGTLNIIHAMREKCPDAHLVKLGTMGEYGTPDVDIPEGFFDIEYRGRKARLPFPRQPGSWYHLSKAHDSANLLFAAKVYGTRTTDIMQGVVYGIRTKEMGDDERMLTRFDFDECFGTAINRFCAQAVIEQPLTPYGKGGQTRGYIPLRESIQCMRLAIENPPKPGEPAYRVFNQFARTYTVTELAHKVMEAGAGAGVAVEVQAIENPRIEAESHYYNPDHQKLFDLGYKPALQDTKDLEEMLIDLVKYKERILEKRHVLIPEIRWDGKHKKSENL